MHDSATVGMERARLGLLGLLALLLGLLAIVAAPGGAQSGRTAPVLNIQGAIGPATADYIAGGVADAAEEGAPLIFISMDTPGGLDTSMREIIRAILGSPVPVVTYVNPGGARAASAGTYILYASHIAAMAPATNVGAATPVQIGGGGNPLAPAGKEKDEKDGKQESPSGSASNAKAVNDAVAYLRSLAELRGRNAEWAEAAVRSAASLSASEALQRDVVDLVARDFDHLLAQLDGRVLTIGERQVTLTTRDLRLVDVEPNWRTRLLAAITNPNVALILMMIGIYGLIFEFMNPGSLYPGTIGAICLLLALYALAALPTNYAGIGLILLGLALMAGEAFSPSFGILGIGGILAFVLGGGMLFDTDLPQFRIGWPVLLSLAVAGLAGAVLVGRLAVTSRRRKVVSGREQMLGATGEVIDWKSGRGHVFTRSERWRATGPSGLKKGDEVRVTGIDGLTLRVEPGADPTGERLAEGD